jgi:hypothetical protein
MSSVTFVLLLIHGETPWNLLQRLARPCFSRSSTVAPNLDIDIKEPEFRNVFKWFSAFFLFRKTAYSTHRAHKILRVKRSFISLAFQCPHFYHSPATYLRGWKQIDEIPTSTFARTKFPLGFTACTTSIPRPL